MALQRVHCIHLPPPMHAVTAWYAVNCESVVYSVDSIASHRLQALLLHSDLFISGRAWPSNVFIASIFLRRCMLSLHGTLSTAKVLCIVSILLLIIVYKHCSYIRISSAAVEHGPLTFIASIFLRRCMLTLHGTLSTAEVLCLVSGLCLVSMPLHHIVYKHRSYI